MRRVFRLKQKRKKNRVRVERVNRMRTSSAGGRPMLKRDFATTLETPQRVAPVKI
jgi:hypothetical protein